MRGCVFFLDHRKWPDIRAHLPTCNLSTCLMQPRTILCNQRIQTPSERVSPKSGPTSCGPGLLYAINDSRSSGKYLSIVNHIQFISLPWYRCRRVCCRCEPSERVSPKRGSTSWPIYPTCFFSKCMTPPSAVRAHIQVQGQGVMPSLRMAISFLIRLCDGSRSSTAFQWPQA